MLVVYDEIFGDHLRGIPHAESPDRATVVASFLRKSGHLSELVSPRDATDAEITRVHTANYLETVKRETQSLRTHAAYLSTGDTIIDTHSLTVARRAAGGALTAMELAVEQNRPVFALIRPPGAARADQLVFEIFDADGTPLTLFYVDYFARANKQGGAWCNFMNNPSGLDSRKPILVNVASFTKPAAGQPALISFDDVTTMVHERSLIPI